jgi:hypothetical protein
MGCTHRRNEFTRHIVMGGIEGSSITDAFYGLTFRRIQAFERALLFPFMRRAYDLACQVHWGEWRKFEFQPGTTDPQPYFNHPLQIAYRYFLGIPGERIGIICALLHDVFENAKKYPKYLLKQIDEYKSLPEGQKNPQEFFKNHVTPLFLEFAAKKNIRLSPDEASDAAINQLEGLLKQPDAAKEFTDFVSAKVEVEFGWVIWRIIRLLTRLSDEGTYKNAFLKRGIPKWMRKIAACVKCLDVTHNLSTLDIENNPKAAAKAICRAEDAVEMLAAAIYDPREEKKSPKTAEVRQKWVRGLRTVLAQQERKMIRLGMKSYLDEERATRAASPATPEVILDSAAAKRSRIRRRRKGLPPERAPA